MKKFKSFLAVLLSLVLIMASMMPSTTSYAATAKETQSITLNVKSKVTMYVGTSKKITVNSVTPKGSSKSSLSEASVDIKFTGTEVNENLLMDERIDSTKVRVQY